MVDSPVSIKRVAADSDASSGDGKQKYVVREREYDILSLGGLKVLGKLLFIAISVTVAILTAYYTAEAGQNDRITITCTSVDTLRSRHDESMHLVVVTLERIERRLEAQGIDLKKAGETIVRVETRQQSIQGQIEDIKKQVHSISRP